MPERTDTYLLQFYKQNRIRRNIRQIVISLSLAVILVVFWSLKLTGIGIAGEAFCGKDEHVHTAECPAGCTKEEHIHDATCYSNIHADLETSEDWDALFADMAQGPTVKENAVLIAQSQLGYTESILNFQVDALGTRRGITRYGQWYGNPYGDWSAMFASFCLHYAGARGVPTNAGPEALRLEWQNVGLYQEARSGTPKIGNLLFLTADKNAGANAVAIITAFDGTTITAIQGDIDNTVSEVRYKSGDAAVMGYGLVPEADAIVLITPAPANASTRTLWLDGTEGGLAHLTGSPNTANSVKEGSTIRLPLAWTSPSKYSYKLRGWYDVSNAKYYPAGGTMQVTGNAVLYADWVASSYDLGQFNAQVADTVTTNSFITTHMFDYNYLFNVHSANPRVTVSSSSHSETWSMVGSGAVNYQNGQTLDLIFAESDGGGRLSNPSNRTYNSTYHSATTISDGIYDAALGELLFSPNNAFDPATGSGVIGKTYLGTGDHLFQIMNDPTDEYYGYYYYDSLRNATSYNQSNGRFYVYEYLSATSDAIGSSYADFLPLNSPYANTNGKTPATYTYNGHHDEYRGVTHYRYDTKYSDNSNSANNVYTEFAYGMRTDINFYLSNEPNAGGNKDIYGNDIQFHFSGDDDLWVLIDGIMVLDIGGIHQRIGGTINFSTGAVTVNGRQAPSLMDLGIGSGDHTLTVLYLERGGSMSNCSIYFNLVPRMGLEIQKEDVLTQQPLNGAKFTIYEDFACTKPAELWESEDAYNQDLKDGVLNQYQSTFTVSDGVAKIWGLGSGKTYYIKETGPPNVEGYGLAEGVIRLTVKKEGQFTYDADVVADADGNQPSNGFTVHNVRIDDEANTMYIVVTNAPETVIETTTVQVIKKWMDTKDHSNDYISAYLTVTDANGVKRRIREIILSDENEWMYTWTNLPKYDYDNLEEVIYGVDEAYESGYYSTVRKITQIEISTTEWAEAASFKSGESYILKTSNGYLSTTSASDGKLKWVDEATAKESPLANWTVTVSSGKVKFVNGAGQVLTYNNGNNSNSRYFYATTSSSSYQTFTPVDAGSGFRFYVTRSNKNYYMASLNASTGRISSSTSSGSGMILIPMKEITQTDIQQVKDWAYEITNTPLASSNETSFTVKKAWDIPVGYDVTLYHEFAIPVKLFANGVDTGRSITLTLKNNWQGQFLGLPYTDDNGNVIRYTVQEIWDQSRWVTKYGEIITSSGSPPTYSITITNTYLLGGPMLPSTGSSSRLLFILCGSGIMLGSLVYGIGSRRKRERRME